MKRVYNENIAKAIKSYLDTMNVQYGFEEENGKFTFKYYQIKIVINVNKDDFYTYAYAKLNTSEETRPLVYKYIHKISHNESFSHFTYDEDTDCFLCQCYTNCFNLVPSREIIEESILSVALRTDAHYDIFCDIADGKMISDEVVDTVASFEFRRTN